MIPKKNTAIPDGYAFTFVGSTIDPITTGTAFGRATFPSGTQAQLQGTVSHAGNGVWRINYVDAAEMNADQMRHDFFHDSAAPVGFTFFLGTRTVNDLRNFNPASDVVSKVAQVTGTVGQAASVAGTVGQAASVAGTVGAAAVVLGTVGQAASVKAAVVAGTVSDKSGYSLAADQKAVTVGAVAGTVGAAASVSAAVVAGTVNDKSDYLLGTSQTGVTLGAIAGTVGQASSVRDAVVAGTVSDKTGYHLRGTQSFDNAGQTANLPANVKAMQDTALSGTAITHNFSTFFANGGTVSAKVVQDVGASAGGAGGTNVNIVAVQGVALTGTFTGFNFDAFFHNDGAASGKTQDDVGTATTNGPGVDTVTMTINVGGTPIPDAKVWITSDSVGNNLVAGAKFTNDAGEVQFLLNDGLTYYLWMEKNNYNPILGDEFVAEAD